MQAFPSEVPIPVMITETTKTSGINQPAIRFGISISIKCGEACCPEISRFG
jgi:hypothetical protein